MQKSSAQHLASHYTLVSAIKDKTAIAVNIMVGISITTADPTFVPKKEIAAIHPLKEGKQNKGT